MNIPTVDRDGFFSLKHCVIDFSFSTSCLKLLFQLGNVKHKYDADEQAAIQHFEVSQVYKISFIKISCCSPL